jgi:hypothetical protein
MRHVSRNIITTRQPRPRQDTINANEHVQQSRITDTHQREIHSRCVQRSGGAHAPTTRSDECIGNIVQIVTHALSHSHRWQKAFVSKMTEQTVSE